MISVDRREREKAMMSDPTRWPLRPTLPVKQRLAPGVQGFPAVGTLTEGEGFTVTKWNGERLQFPDVEALLDAGWVVD